MAKRVIAIDAMGGDFGAYPILEGVVLALKEYDFDAILVGQKSEILEHFPTKMYKKFQQRIKIVEASDVIGMSDHATDALKRKESSIYKATDLVRNGEANGVVSAGHSGATMSLATLRIGRIKGISRPAIATLMPTKTNSHSLVLDVGANVDCKSEHLVEFAIMGVAYASKLLNKPSPKVGLLSNGEESSKGTEMTKQTLAKLKEMPNFIGYVEGNDIFEGSVDVVVCDGFVGNIVLKTSEGVASAISHFMKAEIKRSPIRMAGAMLMKKVFRQLKKKIDYTEYGGAPLIGVNGCAIVSHGKSTPKAIKNAIAQAIAFSDSNVVEDIANRVSNKG